MALEREASIVIRGRDLASKAIGTVNTGLTRMGTVGQAAFAKVSAAATRARATLNSTAVGMIASLVGIQQAFIAVTEAVQFQEELGFLDARAAAFGLTARQLTKDVIDAANGQLSLADATTVAFRALQAGLDPTQLRTFVKLADALGDTIGKSVVVTLDMLIAGVARGRLSFAKQAGIFLDMEKTLSEMAKATGRSTASFSEQERQVIAVNAVMKQAIPILKQFEAQTISNADRMNVFIARAKDARLAFGIGLTAAFLAATGGAKSLVSSMFAIAAVIVGVATITLDAINAFGIFDATVEGLQEKLAGLNGASEALATEGFRDIEAAFGSLTLGSNEVAKALPPVRTALNDIASPAQAAATEINAVQQGIDDLLKSLDALDAQIASTATAPFTPEQLGVPQLPAITPGILTATFVPKFDITAFEAETAVIQAAEAERDALLIEDSRVRLLEAQGEQDIAEQLAFELRNERQLEMLAAQGTSAVALNAVKNAQLAEQEELSAQQFARLQQVKLQDARIATAGIGALAVNLTALLGKNNALAFVANKAFATASAILNTAEGVTKALTLPFPLNFAVAAAIGVAGAAQLAVIAGVGPGGGGGGAQVPSGGGFGPGFQPGGPIVPIETRETRPQITIVIQGNNVDQTEFGRIIGDTLKDIQAERI